MPKVRSVVAASKVLPCSTSVRTVSTTRRMAGASAAARGVGRMQAPVLTKSGSPNSTRSRPSAALVAGWLRPMASAARDAHLLAEAGGQVRPVPRQDVLPRLEAGLVDAGRPHDANGTIFPQPFLLEGEGDVRVRFDERAGDGWLLVVDAAAGALPADAAPALARLHVAALRIGGPDAPGGALREAEGVLARWFARHGCAAALVRPDRYVYGVAAQPGDVPSLLARLEARLR